MMDLLGQASPLPQPGEIAQPESRFCMLHTSTNTWGAMRGYLGQRVSMKLQAVIYELDEKILAQHQKTKVCMASGKTQDLMQFVAENSGHIQI